MMNEKSQELLQTVYHDFMNNGANMFIATRLAPTERQHASVYYSFMAPISGSVIVDMGSGIGEHGAWFHSFDPTLHVINIVNDKALIDIMVDKQRPCIYTSFTNTMLPDESADIVMFNESIGYEELEKGFKEAVRILKPNGELYIKDFSITDPLVPAFHLDSWGYQISKDYDIITEANKQGLSLQTLLHPDVYMDHWYKLIESSEVIKNSAGQHDPDALPLCTALYKFKKGNLNGRVD